MKRKKIVLFSGGLDSTYLLYDLLLKDKNEKIYTVYFQYKGNENRLESELKSRKKLLKMFLQDFKNTKIIDEEKFLDFCVYSSNEFINKNYGHFYLPFPFIFFSALFFDDAEVNVGIVMQDISLSFIEDFKKIFKIVSNGRNNVLKFPKIKKHKIDIYNSLPKKYFDAISFCDNPKKIKGKFMPCKKCDSCKRYFELIKNN